LGLCLYYAHKKSVCTYAAGYTQAHICDTDKIIAISFLDSIITNRIFVAAEIIQIIQLLSTGFEHFGLGIASQTSCLMDYGRQ